LDYQVTALPFSDGRFRTANLAASGTIRPFPRSGEASGAATGPVGAASC